MTLPDLHFSARQRELLGLLSQGKSNKEIAFELNITEGTVKQHLFALFRKLGVTNRTKAVLRAAEINDQSPGLTLNSPGRATPQESSAHPNYLWKLITAVVVQPLREPQKNPAAIVRFDQSLGQLRHQIEHLARLLDCHLLFSPGGAILACLGSPISHLDDPARALYFARQIAQWSQQSDDALEIGIGVATAAEIVPESNFPPIHAESFRLAQQLARQARAGEIRTTEVTCRLAGPLFSSSSIPDTDALSPPGARLLHVEQETTPAILAERNPLPFTAEVVARFKKHRESEWISVESWPPSAGVRLMDAISVHLEAAQLPVIRLRLPTAQGTAQMAINLAAQIDEFVSLNGQRPWPPTGSRTTSPALAALQRLGQQSPHAVCIYGINSLRQVMEMVELQGLHTLAPLPLLFVGMRIHEDASAYVAARMLGANPASPNSSRVFKLALSSRPIAPNELDADLLTLLDILSPVARQWARSIAAQGHILHASAGTYGRELLSCGLFAEQDGIIRCRDEKTRHALRAHLVRDVNKTNS